MSSDPRIDPGSSTGKLSPVLDPVRKHLCDLRAIVDGIQVRPLERNDLKQLMKCLGKEDLREVDLSGADMRGIDIRGMDLSKVIMRGCNLEGAIGMPLVKDVKGVRLPYWDMGYERVLDDWHTTGESPSGISSVEPTTLDGAILSLSNLQGSDLRWAKMRGTAMTRSQLVATNLSYADLSEADLAWAKMDEVTLRRTSLRYAKLEGTQLIDADLTHTDLRDANLRDTYLSSETKLEMAVWDQDYISILEREGNYEAAISLYNRLMAWHENTGLREEAGKFYYRKKESQRKANLESLKEQFGELKHEAGKVLRILRRQ